MRLGMLTSHILSDFAIKSGCWESFLMQNWTSAWEHASRGAIWIGALRAQAPLIFNKKLLFTYANVGSSSHLEIWSAGLLEFWPCVWTSEFKPSGPHLDFWPSFEMFRAPPIYWKANGTPACKTGWQNFDDMRSSEWRN